MSRRIRTFEPTWLDRRFYKTYRKLKPAEQKRWQRDLAELLKALQACSHPATDPRLQRFRPSSYKGVTELPERGQLIEYRLSGLSRVIVCWFPSDPSTEEDDPILLVAATVTHDHERIQRLLRQHHRQITPDHGLDEPDAPP